MYRSFSELSRYGSQVFQLFAQYEEENQSSISRNGKNVKCCNSLISLTAVKEAIYLLLGVYPSKILLESLMSLLPEETRTEKIHSSIQIIDKETFIHFLLLIGPYYKQVLQCKEYSNREAEPIDNSKNKNSWDNTSWVLFNALSTSTKNNNNNNSKENCKGYISLEDLLSASNLPDKFQECNAEFNDSKNSNYHYNSVNYNKRKLAYSADVIARVFTLLDTDRDGKLQYSDTRKYLY